MKTNVYILEGLDCANSVSELEQEIRTIEGLKHVSITLAAKQMWVTAENPDALLEEIKEVIAKEEPDVTVTKKEWCNHSEEIVIDYHHPKRRKGVRRKKPKRTRKSILVVLGLCIFVMAGLYSYKTVLMATEMRLAEYEGTVTVLNSRKKDVLLKEQLPLYSGYTVHTGSDGFAHILLDDTKLILLSTDGQAEIESTKDGKHLTITADPAEIFFAITEKLEDDETLYFKNRNSVIAIRGTVGFYRQISNNESQIAVLEGTIEISDLNKNTTKIVTTGQIADFTIQSDGSADITVRQILSGDIPAFVSDELMQNEEVVRQIEENGGTIEYPEKADFVYEDSEGLARREVDEEISQETHTWRESFRVAATCEEDGYVAYKCDNCAETKTEILKARGTHTWRESRRVETMCEEDGYVAYKCDNCAETKTEILKARGTHTWRESRRVEAMCEEDGYVAYECDDCAETKTEILEAKGTHTWRESFRAEATCEEDGYVDYECDECAEIKTEIIENATGHNWEEIIDTVEVEEEVKQYFYRCDGCGEKWHLDGNDDTEALRLWESHVLECPEGGNTFSKDYEYTTIKYVYEDAVVGKYCTYCGYEIEVQVHDTQS